MESKGNAPKHVRITLNRIEAASEGCGFNGTPGFSASKLADGLMDQREDVAEKMSIATRHYHLRAVKGFVACLIRDRRTDSNPFIHVARSPKLARHSDRRLTANHDTHLSLRDWGMDCRIRTNFRRGKYRGHLAQQIQRRI